MLAKEIKEHNQQQQLSQYKEIEFVPTTKQREDLFQFLVLFFLFVVHAWGIVERIDPAGIGLAIEPRQCLLDFLPQGNEVGEEAIRPGNASR